MTDTLYPYITISPIRYISHMFNENHCISGLKVMVNIGQDDYTDQFGEAAGARVLVKPHQHMPFPEDDGIMARPSQLTSVAIRKVGIHTCPKGRW